MNQKIARVLGLLLIAAPFTMAFAQNDDGVTAGLIAFAAALAIGISAMATAWAMAAIGTAGVGAIVERPAAFGQILIYLVIPETIIIFGFVIAFLLNGQVG